MIGLPLPPDRYDPSYERERNRALELADAENVKSEGKRLYTITNATTSRTMDANAADGAADLAALKVVVAAQADVIATMYADLKEKKLLG